MQLSSPFASGNTLCSFIPLEEGEGGNRQGLSLPNTGLLANSVTDFHLV